MKTIKRFVLTMWMFGFMVLTAAALSACTAAPKSVVLDGADKESVLAISEPAADNLFAGLNAGDYAVFSRDFNAAMLKGIDEKGFTNLQGSITPKIGKYRRGR